MLGIRRRTERIYRNYRADNIYSVLWLVFRDSDGANNIQEQVPTNHEDIRFVSRHAPKILFREIFRSGVTLGVVEEGVEHIRVCLNK